MLDKTEKYKRHRSNRSMQTIEMHLQKKLKACEVGQVNEVIGSGLYMLVKSLWENSSSQTLRPQQRVWKVLFWSGFE